MGRVRRYLIGALIVLLAVLFHPAGASPAGPSAAQDGRIVFASNLGIHTCYVACQEDADDPNWDLWTLYPEDRAPTRLTYSLGREIAPEWSPDLDRIVYASDDRGTFDIYVTDAQGISTERLTDHPAAEFFPTWSPDGSKIAFVRNQGRFDEIVVMRRDGSRSRIATTLEWPQMALDLDWAPSGRSVALVIGDKREGSVPLSGRLNLLDTGRGTLRGLRTPRLGYVHGPSWSPDGKTIVFVGGPVCDPRCERKVDIWTIDANGAKLGRLLDNHEEELLLNPVWSRDGSKILFARWRFVVGRAEVSTGISLWTVDPDGRDLERTGSLFGVKDFDPQMHDW